MMIGDQRVPEGVAIDDRALGQPLGSRGAQVVLAQHLQHARAGQARDRRRGRQRQGEGRQRQARPPLAAQGGKPPELNGEHQHQHQTQPESGHGDADERDQHGEEVRPAAAPDGRGHPGEHAEHRGQPHRHESQLDGRPGVLQQDARHRPVLLERLAEIPVERAPEEAPEPDRERIVQPQLLAQDLDVLGRGPEVRHEHRRRIAGQRVHEGEDGGRHPEQHEQGGGEPPGEKAGHAVPTGAVGAGTGGRAPRAPRSGPGPIGLRATSSATSRRSTRRSPGG